MGKCFQRYRFCTKTMEGFLRIAEELLPLQNVEASTDVSRFKFFTTKVKVWDYASLSHGDYQKPSVENDSSILKNYYADMCKRYSSGSGILLFLFCWPSERLVWLFFSGLVAALFSADNFVCF